jgi:general secretion pathway protein C
MKTISLGIWWLRMATFLLAALAAASATYWVLKWNTSTNPKSAPAPAFTPAAQTDPQVVARLLGGGQSAAVAAAVQRVGSQFKLTGVVAERSKSGYALISIDGQAAKPYRVGAAVTDALILQSVAPRSASLAASLDAPVSVTLELPVLARSDGKPANPAGAASAATAPNVVNAVSPAVAPFSLATPANVATPAELGHPAAHPPRSGVRSRSRSGSSDE